MPKRIIIINWSFQIIKDEILVPEGTKEYQIVDSSEDLIITCNMNKNQIEDFKSLIKERIEKSNDQNLLVMLHKGNEVLEINIKEISANHNLIKIREFGGGSNAGHPIYYNQTNLGLLGGSKLADNALTTIGNQEIKKVKKEHFEFVWEYYWNKLDLENQKKKIINLWLPLAIDIQGLSEVKDNQGKANEYFTEIKKENGYLNLLLSFPKEEDFPRWDEIKSTLSTDYKNFNPTELVSAIISAQDFNSFKLNDKQYLESKIGDNPNPSFLPNWLQEVVTIIDKKINESA